MRKYGKIVHNNKWAIEGQQDAENKEIRQQLIKSGMYRYTSKVVQV